MEDKATGKIMVKVRNAYGRELIDPCCALGVALASYKGAKTFTRADLTALQNMGFEVELAL